MIAFFVCSAETLLLLRYEHLVLSRYSILSTQKTLMMIREYMPTLHLILTCTVAVEWPIILRRCCSSRHTLLEALSVECAKGEEEFLLD